MRAAWMILVSTALLQGCADLPRIAEKTTQTAPQVVEPFALTPGSQSTIKFPGDEGLTLVAHLKIPAAQFGPFSTQNSTQNASPKFGAVVFQHGCGGPGANGKLSLRHQAAMDWAAERGLIALHVDSLSPRGEKEICTQKFSDRKIAPKHRVADSYAALRFLASHPRVDASKIVLWGWSHGGSSVLGAMNATVAEPVAIKETLRFASAISFYPGCSASAQSRTPYRAANPTLILIGEADDWTPAAPCKALGEAAARAGQPLTVALYPDAYHGFDDPNPNAKVRVRADVPNGVNPGRGVTVGPNPQARALAMQAVEQFFVTQKIISRAAP
jgi:dienelactone hydrolase